MNSDEVNWLLQTIEDPENAKRFVQAQYQRGRIPYHVMASLARDRNWTDWPPVEKPAALISMECITRMTLTREDAENVVVQQR
jgi:hypothetical protein